jgi:TRAP-type C4-dicarboxylate transport system permease small subunit
MAVLNKIRFILQIVTSLILLLMVLTPVTQIILRLLSAPFIGAEEMTRYLLIALVFLGSPLAVWMGGHIAMDQFQRFFPKQINIWLRFVITTSCFLVFGYLTVSGTSLITKMYANTSPALVVPFWVIMTPVVVGFLLLTIEYAVEMVNVFKNSALERELGSF